MTYSPAQARKYLRIAEPTLSRYSRLFTAYLSPTPPNRHRRYTQKDLMILSQVRSLSAHGKRLRDIPQLLSKPDELPEIDQAESGPDLQQSFDALKGQVQLLAEIIQAQEQTYKRLLKIAQERNEAILRLVNKFQTVEEKVNQDARFLLTYKKEFADLRNLVIDHKLEKHTLAGFLGL